MKTGGDDARLSGLESCLGRDFHEAKTVTLSRWVGGCWASGLPGLVNLQICKHFPLLGDLLQRGEMQYSWRGNRAGRDHFTQVSRTGLSGGFEQGGDFKVTPRMKLAL